MAEKGGFGGTMVAEEEEIVDVEVEKVADGGSRAAPSAPPPDRWQFPADFFGDMEPLEDIIEVEVLRGPSARDAGRAPAAPSPKKRLKPPVNRTETLLRVLIAVALVALVCLGVYLFSIASPDRYAVFRSSLPDSWRFLPDAMLPASPGSNLPDQD